MKSLPGLWASFALFLFATRAVAAPELAAQEIHRFRAPEARQGVAADGANIYAISNSKIGKYDKRTGRRVALWTGDPKLYPHLNSCEVVGKELVCAASNYPNVPMESRVEVFDPVRMVHLRTIALGRQGGSLTWVDRHDGAWWCGFANYDGKGGEPGRDHRFSKVMTFNDSWKPLRTWTFPEAVLARFAPHGTSGGGWGDDGLLYVSGHDEAEVYAMRAPATGGVLELVATIKAPIEGQAIGFDKSQERVLLGISRANAEVVAMKLPVVK
jgi:hypothetical protein